MRQKLKNSAPKRNFLSYRKTLFLGLFLILNHPNLIFTWLPMFFSQSQHRPLQPDSDGHIYWCRRHGSRHSGWSWHCPIRCWPNETQANHWIYDRRQRLDYAGIQRHRRPQNKPGHRMSRYNRPQDDFSPMQLDILKIGQQLIAAQNQAYFDRHGDFEWMSGLLRQGENTLPVRYHQDRRQIDRTAPSVLRLKNRQPSICSRSEKNLKR